MAQFIKTASEAVNLPEVQAMLKRLDDFGLGIFVPHMHGKEGDFEKLPDGVVQIEENMKIEFMSKTDPNLPESITVGWRWSTGDQSAMACSYCQEHQKHC